MSENTTQPFLEEAGLVNERKVKNLPGRKSDVQESHAEGVFLFTPARQARSRQGNSLPRQLKLKEYTINFVLDKV
jgi:hypothetical protein